LLCSVARLWAASTASCAFSVYFCKFMGYILRISASA
jgi:hypothetical protein